MPTFIGHAVTGIAFSSTVADKRHWLRISILCILCAVAPDFDVIGFRLGIPYQHWLGHRGFSHSIIFAAIIAVIACLFAPRQPMKTKGAFFYVFFASGMLHSVLDAMTNGGLGVAFFSPFSETRYFLPWQPIEVSPLSIKSFFTLRGFRVIKSELLYVIIPSVCFILFMAWYRRRKAKAQPETARKPGGTG